MSLSETAHLYSHSADVGWAPEGTLSRAEWPQDNIVTAATLV